MSKFAPPNAELYLGLIPELYTEIDILITSRSEWQLDELNNAIRDIVERNDLKYIQGEKNPKSVTWLYTKRPLSNRSYEMIRACLIANGWAETQREDWQTEWRNALMVGYHWHK